MTKYYSQAGEDRFIFENIISVNSDLPKAYIEVGALDGLKYSNTKYFEDELDWSGVLIEPNPVSYAALVENREGNVLVNALVSSSEDSLEYSYFESGNLAAVSGVANTITPKNNAAFYTNNDEWLIRAREKHLKTVVLDPVTLDTVLEKAPFDSFGFCSIDVEGHELQVLESYSFSKRIEILLVEINQNDDAIAELLQDKGYSFYSVCSNNNVFVTNELHSQLRTSMSQKKIA